MIKFFCHGKLGAEYMVYEGSLNFFLLLFFPCLLIYSWNFLILKKVQFN